MLTRRASGRRLVPISYPPRFQPPSHRPSSEIRKARVPLRIHPPHRLIGPPMFLTFGEHYGNFLRRIIQGCSGTFSRSLGLVVDSRQGCKRPDPCAPYRAATMRSGWHSEGLTVRLVLHPLRSVSRSAQPVVACAGLRQHGFHLVLNLQSVYQPFGVCGEGRSGMTECLRRQACMVSGQGVKGLVGV